MMSVRGRVWTLRRVYRKVAREESVSVHRGSRRTASVVAIDYNQRWAQMLFMMSAHLVAHTGAIGYVVDQQPSGAVVQTGEYIGRHIILEKAFERG